MSALWADVARDGDGGMTSHLVRAERLVVMLVLMLAQPRTTRELARRFGVQQRTVQRDMLGLQAMGIPMVCQEGEWGIQDCAVARVVKRMVARG